jgi:hypothetical protein
MNSWHTKVGVGQGQGEGRTIHLFVRHRTKEDEICDAGHSHWEVPRDLT